MRTTSFARSAIALLLAAIPLLAADLKQAELERLVQEIANTSDATAADALIDAYVTPLQKALATINDRPYEEQLRVAEALSRVTAHLRMRLTRQELAAEDQARFDRIAKREPRLLEELFHDHDDVRMAALQRIPLEKNTMAGVLIAAKLRDWNAEIAALALDQAIKLQDDSVVRGARTFARDALELINQGGGGGLSDPYVAVAYASFLDKAALILARNGAEEDVPLLNTIIGKLNKQPVRRYALELRDTIDAIGAMKSAALAEVLVPLLNERDLQRLPSLENGASVTRTSGDGALVALLKIYELDPAALGMVRRDTQQTKWGFTSDEERTKAHLLFRAWYRDNAERDPADRKPLSSIQPETKETP